MVYVSDSLNNIDVENGQKVGLEYYLNNISTRFYT